MRSRGRVLRIFYSPLQKRKVFSRKREKPCVNQQSLIKNATVDTFRHVSLSILGRMLRFFAPHLIFSNPYPKRIFTITFPQAYFRERVFSSALPQAHFLKTVISAARSPVSAFRLRSCRCRRARALRRNRVPALPRCRGNSGCRSS